MKIFDFTKDHILEDERVLLRPLQMADFDHLLPFSLNEPEIWQYSLQTAVGADNLKKYIETALNERQEGRAYPFIVFDKKTAEYAGSTRFYEIQNYHRTLLLGYTWYGKRFQRTGLNKHAKFQLLRFAFEDLGMERVELKADASNERSIGAMKSIGCQVEGVLRSHTFAATGKRRDSVVLSMLRNEWEGGCKQNLIEQMNQYK